MKTIHGTWIPGEGENFLQEGEFVLWVEHDSPTTKTKTVGVHPNTLNEKELGAFLCDSLGLEKKRSPRMGSACFFLPGNAKAPFYSPEMSLWLGLESQKATTWKAWTISVFQSQTPIETLKELHFLASHQPEEFQLGFDLHFWRHFFQALQNVIVKDQYIPALSWSWTAKKKKQVFGHWEFISARYERLIAEYSESMPPLCAAGFPEKLSRKKLHEPESLLRHLSENMLQRNIFEAEPPQTFMKTVYSTLLEDCLCSIDEIVINRKQISPITNMNSNMEELLQWQSWKNKLTLASQEQDFTPGFQLHAATSPKDPDDWYLEFLAISKQDPSFRVPLQNYWKESPTARKRTQKMLGKNLEEKLLLHLGLAARMYPKIWDGLNSETPAGVSLTLQEAFEFLKEFAWLLQDSAYTVIVPSWWTPQGRKREKIRLKMSAKKSSSTAAAKTSGLLSLPSLLNYDYQLTIGGESVSQKEWQELVSAKTPLVHFRGEWIELDQDKMRQMLEFWQQQSEEQPTLNLIDLMKIAAEEGDDLEVDYDEALGDMLEALNDQNKLKVLNAPDRFQGELREYQKRGLSWLHYLEQLGLNPCLADDMGLGKTIQVIALLQLERQNGSQPLPTLLIAPTSVIGNWQREIEKFAPDLSIKIHHGSDREKEKKAFITQCEEHDVVITSFSLARMDEKLTRAMEWQRVVLDEAQNIKNPKSKQTRAICKIPSRHKLAMTGTPIENRLLDLWSLFNFLNPGYLGTQALFGRKFEKPIQRENNKAKSNVLKQLVEPFILRRLKTDKNIIKDLPDKVEQKIYCNLSKEQASLYEAVVKDVEEQLEEAEGIQRKGLMLSTLGRLKQICNHPAQFLKDDSEFSAKRSHKLARLLDMIEEANESGDSVIIFSQYREIGDSLQRLLQKEMHYPVYFIHGGVSREKREKMIQRFQDENTPPSIFILSLKAGGVGITLTKANQVFHFDRWWNPAVEEQATDRAFRIGQKKNVFVHKFVSTGTLEEKIDQMIEEKKALSSSIVGNDESWLTELDNQAFKKLIALNRSTVMED